MKIVLEETEAGKIVVEKQVLETKVGDLYPDDPTIPPKFKNKKLVEWIKEDAEDRLGYNKHKNVLRREGYDV